MFLPWYAIKARFGRWFAEDARPNTVRGLVSGFFGGAMGGLLTFVLIHHYSAIDASVGSSADVMSTANTYIVYSALIVTAVAAFMTIAGLIFTQHFSMEKEGNLSRAYDTLIEELKIENEKAEKIMKEIIKNEHERWLNTPQDDSKSFENLDINSNNGTES